MSLTGCAWKQRLPYPVSSDACSGDGCPLRRHPLRHSGTRVFARARNPYTPIVVMDSGLAPEEGAPRNDWVLRGRDSPSSIIHPDLGVADHRAPFVNFRLQERRELRGRRAFGVGTELLEA